MADPTGERVPTVIVDDAHIIYRVYGASGQASNTPVASLKRLVTRTKSAAVRDQAHNHCGLRISEFELFVDWRWSDLREANRSPSSPSAAQMFSKPRPVIAPRV